jgi:hypothetical protein
LLLAIATAARPQAEVKDRVVLALKTGNTRELAAHLLPNVDLTIMDNSEVYSKAQAEQILRKFFDEHEPLDMTVDHEGVSKMGDAYCIGKLKTARGDFRVTFFLKKTGGKTLVKQLRIEAGKGDL